jgi:hypothetical protein
VCVCDAGYDGEKLRVRKRDDVYNEEYSAYLLVEKIKAEKQKHAQKKSRHTNKQ